MKSTFFIALAVLLGLLAVLFQFFSPSYLLLLLPSSHTPQNDHERVWTKEEVAVYNGTDDTLPILLGILGSVFDVTDGRSHYGPGGGYSHFAGRDASRAFISGNFTGDGLTDSLHDLTTVELKSLVDWRGFYHKSYKYVGKLVGRYNDSKGNPSKYLKGVEAKAARGAQLLEKHKVEDSKFKSCNSRWSQDEGGEGCEGSVLLDDTDSSRGEKNSFPNRNSARGFEVIDSIKSELEKACPSTVSCTDILTLAARDAVSLTGGPFWPVALGRRDGRTASESDANQQIPSPSEPLANITSKFTSKGLSFKDLVILSGAHTIGFAQCSTFKRRLFNFDSTGKSDPSLDTSLLSNLRSLCPDESGSDTTLAPLDPLTTNKFDNVYYKNLSNSSGLLESDQALMGNSNGASLVGSYSKNPLLFLKDFEASMVKMANIGVLTGENGEIRKNCRVVN